MLTLLFEDRSSRVLSKVGLCLAATALGCAAGAADLRAAEVQSAVLMLIISGFAIALPGWLSPWLAGACCGLGLVLWENIVAAELTNISTLFAIVPALIGGFAGSLTGRRLRNIGESLHAAVAVLQQTNVRGIIPTRVVLALSISLLVVVSAPSVRINLIAIHHPLAQWLSLCWQLATYIGWVVMTPAVLRVRKEVDIRSTIPGHATGIVTIWESALHLGALTLLILAHSGALVVVTQALFIPLGPSGAPALLNAALQAYALPDALAYALIIGLAFASDGHRRDSEIQSRLRELRQALVEAQLTALRAQLNPHFLYNALNAATTLSRAGRNNDTAFMLENITESMRYILTDSTEIVLLSDELNFIRRYLNIQQVRFGERLTFEISCEAPCAAARIPILILQPIVENAVEHGITTTILGGNVLVRAVCDAQNLTIVIENDGSVQTTFSEMPDRVGLGNTKARLEKLYGANASISLVPRVAGGAVARIVLPIMAEPVMDFK